MLSIRIFSARGLRFFAALLAFAPAIAKSQAKTPDAPALRYEVRELKIETPGSTYAYVTALNNQGQIIGLAGGAQPMVPFVWQNGKTQILGQLSGLRDLRPTALNDKGQIVGTARLAGSKSDTVVSAFLWEKGKIRELDALPDVEFRRVGSINNKGQIVGTCIKNGVYYAFLHDGKRMTLLFPGYADAINDSGEIVGRSETANVGVLWKDGKTTSLGTDEGLLINNAEQVIHYHEGDFFLFEKGVTRFFVGDSDRHQTGGMSLTSLNGKGLFDAITAEDGKKLDLNTITRLPAGWHLWRAYGINDRGQILADASEDGLDAKQPHTLHPVLLTPIAAK